MKQKPPTDFLKLLETLCHNHSTRTVFDSFVRLAACSVAAQTREPEYLEEAKRWTRDELTTFSNALGALVMEMETKPFTDIEQLPKDRPITVCEPACGAGAMILSLAQACSPETRTRLRVTAIDINKTACDMCFVNTTLWNIPARIIHGNTLSLETWSAWSNFPLMMKRTAPLPPQNTPPTPIEIEQIKTAVNYQQPELIPV